MLCSRSPLAGLVAGLVAMLFALWLYADATMSAWARRWVEDIRRRIEALDTPLARALKRRERSLKRSLAQALV